MSTAITVYGEEADDGFWTYIQRSAGELPETPLHSVLNWVLEQLNFQNYETERDLSGDVVSVTIGKAATPEPFSEDEAVEGATSRLRAVNVAGILAQSRESGAEPEYAHLPKMATQQMTEWGLRNTEFHYAFELIKVLARLNKKTFNLEAPPIKGTAPATVVSYLRESTRCWLYGFHGASVALSRACLEDALRTKLSQKNDNLECLIDAASKCDLLDDCMAEIAHKIRKTANKFLHGEKIAETASRETLDAVRGIVEQIFT